METKKAKEGKLVEEHTRFVETMAKRYLGKGLDQEELMKAGMIGLTIAAQSYDSARGFKFIAYAMWYIRQGMLMALEPTGNEDGKRLNEVEQRH